MTAVSDQRIGEYLEALRSTSAVPGGGSAAALAGAMGAALVSMVAKLSAKKARTEEDRQALTELVPAIDALSERLVALSQQDIEAYRSVIESRKGNLPADALERAYERAAEVPLETAEAVQECIGLAADVSRRAWEMTASDLAVSSELLQTAMGGALANVAVNLPELKGEAAQRIEARYRRLRSTPDDRSRR
ncbi:MAG TPA: cyclodeaminase/cyclohydrolase family protein [Candidatus Dormibacteraeota bacterium]